MNIDKFNYKLPKELIAQYPTKNRGDSKLLLTNPSLENLKDLQWQTAGSVKIDSENYNIFQNIFNATTSLLIQESGF